MNTFNWLWVIVVIVVIVVIAVIFVISRAFKQEREHDGIRTEKSTENQISSKLPRRPSSASKKHQSAKSQDDSYSALWLAAGLDDCSHSSHSSHSSDSHSCGGHGCGGGGGGCGGGGCGG